MDRNTEDKGAVGDAELLSAVARSDSRAFNEIVRRYYQPVYRLVWRMGNGNADTEDITQEAFMKLWQNPAQLREAAALKGWLMRVAANAVIDRSRRRRHADIDAVPEPADPQPLADTVLKRSQAARHIDRRISLLPERQRLALSLVYFEGLSNIDAAAVLELSVDAVESLLARARRALKESMSKEWRNLLEELT